MGTTLDSSNVRQINFNWQTNIVKQCDLNKAMSHLFTKLQIDIDPLNEPLIVLYDDTQFTTDQVQKGLKSLQNGVHVCNYPSVNNFNHENEIDLFLSDPKGVLLTTHSLFKGSEAENVVSIQQGNVVSSNVRGTLLRSVSRLYILMGLSENEHYKMNDTINDDSLLYCFEKCYVNLFECVDCSENSKNQIIVCFPCARTCHENHKIKVRLIQQPSLDCKCQCPTHHNR